MPEDPIASLRQAHADLSSRSTRFAIAALIVFAAGSLTFARALRSMSGGDVQRRVKTIRGYASVAQERANLPMIADELLKSEEIEPPPGITRAEALAKKQELEAALQRDIEGWFTIEQSALGSTFRFNILYWSPLLPFVLWIAYFYLGVNQAKMKAIRQVMRARMTSETVSPIDALEVGQHSDTTFGTYPGRLAAMAYCGALLTLIGVLVYALAISSTYDVWLPAADVIRYLFALTVYTVLLMRWVRHRVAAEAAVVAGKPFARRETWLRRVAERVRAMVRRRSRGFVWSGAGATLSTLLLTTATQSCGAPKSGKDLFLGRNGAIWPVMSDWQEPLFKIASLGRWMYIISIVFAGVAIIFTLLTLSSRIARSIDRPWVRDVMRCLSVTIFFFSLCELGFIYVPFFGIGNMLPVVWELAYWFVPSLLYIWMTVIRKQRYRNEWQMHVRPFLVGLYAPAIVLVPASLVLLAVFQVIPGIVVYVVGVTLLATGAVVAFESIGEPAPETLPEVPPFASVAAEAASR